MLLKLAVALQGPFGTQQIAPPPSSIKYAYIGTNFPTKIHYMVLEVGEGCKMSRVIFKALSPGGLRPKLFFPSVIMDKGRVKKMVNLGKNSQEGGEGSTNLLTDFLNMLKKLKNA